jgi:prepilin-type N-terminal cleavage/methylation domain-containing protein
MKLSQKLLKRKGLRHSQQATHANDIQFHAFTLTELLISIVIVGILSAKALPNYINQVNRSRQNETAVTIAQIQTTIASYTDEFGVLPTSWAELNDISAVMTDDGPAKANNLEAITLAGGFYNVVISNSDNLFTITATRNDAPNFNIIACINLTNGASAINKGPNPENTTPSPASAPNCG